MAKEHFRRAVSIVLDREGPYANDAWDEGGETKWGIARNAHLDKFPKNLAGEARWSAFGKADALDIYEEQYWDRNNLSDLPWPVALVMFDAGVQHGERTAAFMLQKILKVRVDGIIGPVTRDTVNRWKLAELVARINAARVQIYVKDDDWDIAGNGWIFRISLVTIAAFTE